MRLLLVQHGEATSEEVDPARPLTAAGRADVQRMARALKRMGVEIATIHHSGKLRARQTAELLARELRPATVSQVDGLAPNDDPALTQRVIGQLQTAAMLVGHLPHLSRLASLLLANDLSREIVAFRMAGVVCLERGDDQSWRVQWMVTPDIVQQLHRPPRRRTGSRSR